MNNNNKEFLNKLIGLNKLSASLLCDINGYNCRIVREDTNNYMVTMDMRFDRVNLEIENNRVVTADIG